MKRRIPAIALALATQTALLAAAPVLAQEAATQAGSMDTQGERSWIRQALAWSQERLAQLDANVAVLENEADKLSGEARAKADANLAELRKQRDAYQRRAQDVATNAKNWSDAQVRAVRQTLDDDWAAFQAARDKYLEESKATIATQRAVLQAEFDAQQKALAQLRTDASKLAAEQRTAIDERIAALDASVEDTKTRIAKASSTAWETTKKSYEEAQQLFVETYVSIRQSIEDAAKK